jgi:DNA replication initiation complex subunit (GINS family)
MTEYQYIIDSTSLKQRYDRIQSIIAALELQQLAVVANSDVESYSLDDGQTRISTTYRSADQIFKAIEQYEKISNRILAQLTGTRVMRLADAQAIQSNGSV